jgi:hypothetical protein
MTEILDTFMFIWVASVGIFVYAAYLKHTRRGRR